MEKTGIHPTLRKCLRITARIVMTLLIVGVLFLSWLWYLARPPHYTVTVPPLPMNNAVDDYLRAYRAIQESFQLSYVDIEWWGEHPRIKLLTPESIKKVIKQQVKQSRPYGQQDITLTELRQIDKPLTIAELLQANTTAIILIRAGLQHEYVYPYEYNKLLRKDETKRFEIIQALNMCEKLIDIRALYARNTFDHYTAASYFIDLAQFNIQVGKGYYYCDRIFAELDSQLESLSSAQLRSLTQKLEYVCLNRRSYAEEVENERLYTLLRMTGVFEQGGEWPLLRWTYGLSDQVGNRPWYVNQFYAWTVPDTRIPRIADRYLTECIRIAKLPCSAHAKYPSPPHDTINQSYFGRNERNASQLQHTLREFKLDAMLLTLALHGYHQEHQQYPAQLQELVTQGWLKHLPVDPFTQQDTICYQCHGDRYILYSRGPDGKDDMGNPITVHYKNDQDMSEKQVEKASHYVCVNSIGDVVYGINSAAQMYSNADRL